MNGEQTSHLLQMIFLFRGIERILIQFGAIGCIVAGVMLYRWGIAGTTDATGGNGVFKFEVKNAAPGSVLAMFGMIIMAVALGSPLSYGKPLPALESTAHESNTSGASPKKARNKPETADAGAPETPPAPGATTVAASTGTIQFLQYSASSTTLDQFLESLQDQPLTEKELPNPQAILEGRSCQAAVLLRKTTEPDEVKFLSEVAMAKAASSAEARKLLGEFGPAAQRLRK
jgi:hypothetical protein